VPRRRQGATPDQRSAQKLSHETDRKRSQPRDVATITIDRQNRQARRFPFMKRLESSAGMIPRSARAPDEDAADPATRQVELG